MEIDERYENIAHHTCLLNRHVLRNGTDFFLCIYKMSKREKKGKWFMLRVTDRDRDRRSDYINYLLKKIDTYACAEDPHPEDNDDTQKSNYHYHSLHMRQKSTLKDRLVVKQWTGQPNHAFTHLIADTEEHWRRCLCYISKGPQRGTFPTIIVNSFNFTEEQIWEMHYEWYDKWKGITLKVAKQEETKRAQFLQMYDAIGKEPFLRGPRAVCAEVIQYYQDNYKLEPNDFQLKCYIKTLIRHFVHENYPQQWDRYKRLRADEIVGSDFRYDFLIKDQIKQEKQYCEFASEIPSYPEDDPLDYIPPHVLEDQKRYMEACGV